MVLENLDDVDTKPEEIGADILTPNEIAQLYVQLVWSTHADDSLVCIQRTPAEGRASQNWFRLMESRDMVRKLCDLSRSADTRLSWCAFNWRKRRDSRATELPGLFIDIDLAGRHHDRDDLPTLDESLDAVDRMPRTASLLLDTGGGLLVVWLFDKPLMIDDRAAAKDLLRRWEDQLRQLLPGKHVDKAAKLTAVPRIAGTLNHKSGTDVQIIRPQLSAGSYSQSLTYLEQTVQRYPAAELEDLLPSAEEIVVGKSRVYSEQDKADAIAAAARLSPDQAEERETWIKAGFAIKEVSDCDVTFSAWCRFSRSCERYSQTTDDEYRQTWDGFDIENRGNAVATLIGMSQDANQEAAGEIELCGVVTQKSSAADDDEDLLVGTSDDSWPKALSDTALVGPVGDFVRTIEPFTEADPAALVFQLIVAFGNLIGRNVWFKAEADKHCGNLYCVMVGRSAKGRKGTSQGQVLRLIDLMLREDGSDLDDSLQHWRTKCHADGLSTGAGLIWAVRDEVTRWDNKNQGLVISDPGISDKRLFVSEGEFAQILKVMKREGNDLSPVLRKAWDRGDLRSVVKNDPSMSTGAHVSIIGHITGLELRSHLTETEIGNGFGNRFAWVCVRRSKMLPTTPQFDDAILQPVAEQLRNAVAFSGTPTELTRSVAAEDIWQKHYSRLSRERFGVGGALLSRAEAQVMRLAMLYSLLEQSARIEDRHLLAALELWRYVEDSVAHVFGNQTGHGTADSLHDALKNVPDGMTRTELHAHFSNHMSKLQIDEGLRILLEAGIIEGRKEHRKSGRPAFRYCTL